MDLTNFGKSLSEMTDEELNNQVTKIRRERRVSGKKVVKRKKEAVKRRESHRMNTETVMSGMTLEEKIALRDKLM